MDFLSQCLKKQLDFDTKKYVLMNLAQVYEARRMFSEAAKMMRNAAEINTTYDGKMNDFAKSCVLFTRAGNFAEADVSFTKAMGSAQTDLQKQRIKAVRKDALKAQAKEYIGRDKRSHAVAAYEHLVEIDLTPEEKREAQSTLLALYEKLGKVREYYALKTNM
jgi:tetratricopeptide (TPR) repeat protein